MNRYISVEPIEQLYQSRIRDHMLLAHCIKTLFNFFKEYGIDSLIDTIDSNDSLLKMILESKVTNFNYDPYVNIYTIGIRPKVTPINSSRYFFLFGNGIINNNYLLVEFDNENTQSRINLSLDCEKYLPFIGKYDYEIDSSLIMSLDEFEDFLKSNKRSGRLKVIGVP